MKQQIPDAVAALVDVARARAPLGAEQPSGAFARAADAAGAPVYRNTNPRLNIDFAVERLTFPHLQTMDPRLVRIAPGKQNEHHRHAHESLFVVVSGQGEVKVGEHWTAVGAGDVAFVPRWIFHQTRNTSTTEELVVLAITDFGFTSAVLGDYDRRTRLADHGSDVTSG